MASKSSSGSKWVIGAVVLAIIAGLIAFQFRGRGASDGGSAKTVTIAGIAYPYEGGQVFNGVTGVVIQQGWLKSELAKQGVNLAFTPVPTAVGGPMINESFSGKRIDFASYGDFPAIIAVSGGVPLKLLVPMGVGQNSYLVVRNGLAVKSIVDLKGMRIALHRGRPWELPFSKLIEANGLKLTDFKIVNINPGATPAALASGNVDATFLLSDGLLLEQKGMGHVIWSTKQGPADWKMRAELFARGGFISDNPELTQIVVDAYVRAAAWSADEKNRASVVRDAARGSMPEAIVEKDYANSGTAWRDRFSPLFAADVIEHYRAVADYAFARGLVRSKVATASLLDDRFVAKSLQNLKLEGFWDINRTPPTQSDKAVGATS